MMQIKIKELNRYSNIIWVMEWQIVFRFFEWLFPNFYSEYILFCKQTKKKKKGSNNTNKLPHFDTFYSARSKHIGKG